MRRLVLASVLLLAGCQGAQAAVSVTPSPTSRASATVEPSLTATAEPTLAPTLAPTPVPVAVATARPTQKPQITPRPSACPLRADIPDPYADAWWVTAEYVPLKGGLPDFTIGGVAYDHPVAMAQWGLRFLQEGDRTGAERIADALIAMSELDGQTRMYPYLWAAGHAGQPLAPPWYSAMAQGQVLSVLVRLVQAGDSQYAAAAHQTYRGLLREARVVDGGYWLEEYPVAIPDPVLNGHAFAALGVWDYWRWTGTGDKVLCDAIQTLADHLAANPERAVFYDRNMTTPIGVGDVYRQIHRLTFAALGAISGLTVLDAASQRAMR